MRGSCAQPAETPAPTHSRVLAYVAGVGCLGTGVIAHSLWQVIRAPVDLHWLWLVALTVASSAAVLQLSTSRVAFSIAEIFTFSAVLLFGPAIGTLTVAVDCAVLSCRLAMRGRPLRRTVLSITAPTLAMWIAAHLIVALVDVQSSLRAPLASPAPWLALLAGALTYYLLDTGMIAVAVALDERQSVWRVWRDHFAQLWVSFFVGAHAAGLIVIAVRESGWWFLALVAPIPLLLYYALRTWVARLDDRVVHLQQMHEQAQILHEQQTMRLQAETVLRERDRQFQAVFDGALDALFLVDDQRRVVSANPAACALLNVTGDHLPSSPLDSFLTAGSADEIRTSWTRMLDLGEHKGELVAATGGRERTVEFSFNAGVVPHGHLFVWRDVSERKRLEAQLQQSQKMESVGRLAGGVAHDFNNLLTVIIGNAEMALHEARVEEDLKEILSAAGRGAALTRQLLAFSRKQLLETKVVNPNGVVSNIETMLRRLLDESLEFTSVMDPAVWPVRVDVTQLEQVIVNLVVNARDAMPEGGRLAIATRNVDVQEPTKSCSGDDVAPGAYAVITVSDTGSGMDPDTQARIFEPFFTTKALERGTGLGLSMAYGIVRQSGGHILVDSTPGRGSTFSIYLPRVEPSPAAATGAAGPAVPSVGAETVLLVDDDDAVRSLAGRSLRRQGYTVLSTGSGDEARQLAANREPPIDLLVTDVMMPGMNGPALADALRRENPRLKVIFMSGYADDAVSEPPVGDRTRFLQKPFATVDLPRAVRELLDAGGPPREVRPLSAGMTGPTRNPDTRDVPA